MPRRHPLPERLIPVERADGQITAFRKSRDPETAALIAVHREALAPRRWVPPAEREA